MFFASRNNTKPSLTSTTEGISSIKKKNLCVNLKFLFKQLHAQNINHIPQYLNDQNKFFKLIKDQSYCGTIATKYV